MYKLAVNCSFVPLCESYWVESCLGFGADGLYQKLVTWRSLVFALDWVLFLRLEVARRSPDYRRSSENRQKLCISIIRIGPNFQYFHAIISCDYCHYRYLNHDYYYLLLWIILIMLILMVSSSKISTIYCNINIIIDFIDIPLLLL